MLSPLRLALRILDREVTLATPVACQIWKGGGTNLSTRTIMPHPPRWLVLADHEASQPPPDTARALLSWNLEQILPGHRLSPAHAGGVILVSMDIDPGREAEFDDWYNSEHIPHLSTIPGVLAARRFRSVGARQPGAPAYVALYHVEHTDIYATRTWAAANETPWMRRFQRNRTYFMFPVRVV